MCLYNHLIPGILLGFGEGVLERLLGGLAPGLSRLVVPATGIGMRDLVFDDVKAFYMIGEIKTEEW